MKKTNATKSSCKDPPSPAWRGIKGEANYQSPVTRIQHPESSTQLMNYIKHLNNIMIHFAEDDRLNPSHVSLYMALFQLWNLNKFNNPISIARGEMKKLSKIGSNNTYLKCLKDLTNYGYLKYIPSHNPYKGSEVYLCKFDTSTTQALRHKYLKIDTSTEQALRPSINSINYNKQNIEKEEKFKPPTLDDLKIFFKKKEARRSSKLILQQKPRNSTTTTKPTAG